MMDVRRKLDLWSILGQALHERPVEELLEDFRRAGPCDFDLVHFGQGRRCCMRPCTPNLITRAHQPTYTIVAFRDVVVHTYSLLSNYRVRWRRMWQGWVREETPAILGDDGPVELRVLSDVAHALFRSGVSQGYMSRRKPPAKSPTYLLCALQQDSVSRTC